MMSLDITVLCNIVPVNHNHCNNDWEVDSGDGCQGIREWGQNLK